MRLLAGDVKPNPWASRFGWDRGLISRVFAGKQLPGPEALAQLAAAERVNLTWLLTGEGPPYLVLPPPDPKELPLGPDAHYYLFDRPDGVQPPLVCVRRATPALGEPPLAPAIRVAVYHGATDDLIRAVEWLLWKGQTLYLAEDNEGDVARLRAGLVGNRALIDGGQGLLERRLSVLPMPKMVLSALVEECPNGCLAGTRSALDGQEQEWVMRLRELTAEQRAALLLIVRGLARGD